MFETITKFAGYLEHVTFFTYPVTIFLGFLSGMAAITCCLPLVPAIAGFVGTQDSNRKRLITVPFFAIGMFSNVIGKFTGRWSGLVRFIAGILLLCSGIYFIWKG